MARGLRSRRRSPSRSSPSPGAGGAGAQTPRAGGTVRLRRRSSSPPCLNPLLARCLGLGGLPTLAFLAEKVLEPAFVVSPDFTWRPQLVSGVTFTRKPPFTLTYRIQPRARWSDGVPVTARDFVFTLRARIARKDQLDRGHAGGRRAGAERLGRRREDRSSRPARAACGLAQPVREHPAEARARGGGPRGASGPTGSSTRRRAGRSGAGPSSSSAGSAANS